jgi:hypothetical protein
VNFHSNLYSCSKF